MGGFGEIVTISWASDSVGFSSRKVGMHRNRRVSAMTLRAFYKTICALFHYLQAAEEFGVGSFGDGGFLGIGGWFAWFFRARDGWALRAAPRRTTVPNSEHYLF
jgi:hypothetical protein